MKEEDLTLLPQEEMKWIAENHISFPNTFQKTIKTYLLCLKGMEIKIPKFVNFEIIKEIKNANGINFPKTPLKKRVKSTTEKNLVELVRKNKIQRNSFYYPSIHKKEEGFVILNENFFKCVCCEQTFETEFMDEHPYCWKDHYVFCEARNNGCTFQSTVREYKKNHQRICPFIKIMHKDLLIDMLMSQIGNIEDEIMKEEN